MTAPTLLWFRRDLRLADHPALLAAAADGAPVLGVFILDDVLTKASGEPRLEFLHGCLAALDRSMDHRLLVAHGRPEKLIPQLAQTVGATAVHHSADFGPYGRRRDERVAEALQHNDIQLVATGSSYAVAPGRVQKPGGSPYSVFTPYFRKWIEHGWRKPADSPGPLTWLDPANLKVKRAEFEPRRHIDAQLPEPGEKAAQRIWTTFLEHGVDDYDDERNRPDHEGTSHLSVYLKWGCIHPRTLLADLARKGSAGATSYRRELAFREFYADLLFHDPASLTRSQDPKVDGLQWDTGSSADQRLDAWKSGRTGFPYVDAGMRQLLAEGWIHNRVRMGVASFLIKDLHLPWQVGARHFMEHLVDGDAASNTFGWQWVAGAGPQAAPYYRVFNPIGQGEKFDPVGDYVRKYIPELANVDGKSVHRPWELPGGPPDGYPEPIVDHAAERTETLRRWENRPHS